MSTTSMKTAPLHKASSAHLTSPQAAADWLKAQGVLALTTDSRQSKAATAFIAWPGAAIDGRRFAGSALAQGAPAVLVEAQGWTGTESVATYLNLKADSGLIAAAFYGQPSQAMRVVAITGTNGKTSSSWWLAQAMGGAVVGTLGIGQIGRVVHNGLTTPDPVLLQARLKALLDEGCEVVALEASSIGIAEGRLNGTQIHTAVFTNFTQDHLDYHGSMERYWQAKQALFDTPGLKAAVINLDDVQGWTLLDHVNQQVKNRAGQTDLDVWTISASEQEQSARLQVRAVHTTTQGLAWDVVEGAQSILLQSRTLGRYNISNLMGVIGAMRALGVPLQDAVQACERLEPVPGRLEQVSHQGQPLVLVDYAHTPDALEQVLTALREITIQRGGKLWCVFGCGGDRDASKRPLMGAIATRHADRVVVTSDNPRGETPSAIIAHVLLGLEDDRNAQVQADRALAIQETIAQAALNDVIVIAGKGHEDYQEIHGVKSPFCDQAVARAALGGWQANSADQTFAANGAEVKVISSSFTKGAQATPSSGLMGETLRGDLGESLRKGAAPC